MENRNTAHYDTLVYLGSGARLSLEVCARMADTVWLVEASSVQVQKLERAAAGLANVRVEQTIVDTESRPVTFHEYNLPWVSGLHSPDEHLRRLYPGLRCLTSEERQSVSVNELVERCLAQTSDSSTEPDALLVIDLGDQTSSLLEVLEAGDQLTRFSCVVVVPDQRQAINITPPQSLHGPLPLPHALDWLDEGSRCYLPHPLLKKNRLNSKENAQLRQRIEVLEQHHTELTREHEALAEARDDLQRQLEERTRQRDELSHKGETLSQERDDLQRRLEERTRERDELSHEGEVLTQERDDLQRQLEERTRERDELWHNGEALTQERGDLQRQLEKLTRQRDKLSHKGDALTQERDALREEVKAVTRQREEALHQNHLNAEALKEERNVNARLEQERDKLAHELEATRQQAEHHQKQLQQEQQQRQQLIEQEMLKAEAQLDLVREIVAEGKGF